MNENNALDLSVDVLGTIVLVLRLLLGRLPPFYVVIRATRRSSHLQDKDSTFVSQLGLISTVALFLRAYVRKIYVRK